jgi:hypothetical protein
MIAAPTSCVRMRDVARLGRFEGWDPRITGIPALCAPWAERLTDATGIAQSLGPPPRAASSRPGVDDLVASISL